MTNLVGTNLIAPIVPNTSMDIYPTHWAIYGSGGLRTVPDIAAMNDIPVERRESGMQVYVVANQTYYQLSDDLTVYTPVPSNANLLALINDVSTLRYYTTFANATADLANIPANGFIEVEVDETHNGRIVRYQKVGGVLTFVVYADGMNTRIVTKILTHGIVQTLFPLPAYVPGTNSVQVFINGIFQDPSTYTETNSTTITLSSSVPSGTVIDVITYILSNLISSTINIQTDPAVVVGLGPYTLSHTPAGSLKLLFLDGVLQLPANFSISTNTLTLVGLTPSNYTNLAFTYTF